MGWLDRRGQERSGRALRAWMERLEGDSTIDAKAAPLEKVADAVTQSEAVHDVLRGRWLGHSLHPLMTDFPLGAWISTSFLDFFGGEAARDSARRLVGFGVVSAVPTAAAGVADWKDTTGGPRRVGAVHGAMNVGILACYAGSWLARRGGRQRLGVALAVTGGTAAWISGYLGGHLSLVNNTGIANKDRDGYGTHNGEEAAMSASDRNADAQEEEGQSGPVVHGGKDDPLGAGVADMEESSEVTEGVPEQDGEGTKNS